MDLEIIKNTIFKSRLHKKGTILVVDDEKDAALLISAALARVPGHSAKEVQDTGPAISDEELKELIDALEAARESNQLVTAERDDLIQARDKLTADLDTTTRERDLCIEEIAGLQEDLAKLRAGILELPPKIREKFDLVTPPPAEGEAGSTT